MQILTTSNRLHSLR